MDFFVLISMYWINFPLMMIPKTNTTAAPKNFNGEKTNDTNSSENENGIVIGTHLINNTPHNKT